MADGSSALLGSRVAQSESRVGLDSSRLQSQASDHHLRGPAPAAGPTGIASLRWTACSAVAARQQRPTSHTAWQAGNPVITDGPWLLDAPLSGGMTPPSFLEDLLPQAFNQSIQLASVARDAVDVAIRARDDGGGALTHHPIREQ